VCTHVHVFVCKASRQQGCVGVALSESAALALLTLVPQQRVAGEGEPGTLVGSSCGAPVP
jgi:hypothetical protein